MDNTDPKSPVSYKHRSYKTHGTKVRHEFVKGRTGLMTAGGRKRYIVKGSIVAVNALIYLGNNHDCFGVVILDEADGCRIHDALIFTEEGKLESLTDVTFNFPTNKIYPFTYQLQGTPKAEDRFKPKDRRMAFRSLHVDRDYKYLREDEVLKTPAGALRKAAMTLALPNGVINQESIMGMKVNMDLGNGRKVLFTAGGKKRVVLEDFGHACLVMVNGEVQLADGTYCWALLEIDESSGGEHGGTYIFTPNGLAVQGDEDFCKKLGRTKEQVFSYRYRYSADVDCHDIHVQEDGWSGPPLKKTPPTNGSNGTNGVPIPTLSKTPLFVKPGEEPLNDMEQGSPAPAIDDAYGETTVKTEQGSSVTIRFPTNQPEEDSELLYALCTMHVRSLDSDGHWKGPCEAIVPKALAEQVTTAMNFRGSIVDKQQDLGDGTVRLFSKGYWEHGF